MVNSAGPPDYYLGNHFRFEDKEGIWTYDCNKYCSEAIARVEAVVGDLKLRKTPLPTKDVMDTSPLLTPEEHRFYQQLIGMGIQLQVIGRPDICYAIGSLSRFSCCPQKSHLDLLLHVFGF